MRQSIDRKLRTFLRKEGILEQFIKNAKSEECSGVFVTNKSYTIDEITEAFVWCDSPEGLKFWDDMFMKYFKSR